MKVKVAKKPLVSALSAAMLTGMIAGCGGGGGDTAAGPGDVGVTGTTYVGVFRDSPVGGVHFWAPSHHGKTDADGHFNYVDNENVTFTLDEEGSLKLGGAQGKGVITPMDLMSKDADSILVQAIARTLLQLDEDANPNGGIQLNDQVASILKGKLAAAGIDSLDFEQLAALLDDEDPTNDDSVTQTLDTLYDAVTATAQDAGIYVSEVTYEDAVAHLVDNDIFRKDVSKTPELEDAKAKLNQLDAYVPAMSADEQTVYMPDESGNCEVGALLDGVCKVKPMIITYAGIDFRYGSDGAPDALAAVSRDDGLTWKRVNLSRTGLKEASVSDGDISITALGASRKPVMMTKGNRVVVAWTDHYCKGGSPAYSVLEDTDDVYGVAGSQGLVDYTAQDVEPDRMPNPAVVPYSCVWTARGYVDTESGSVVWSKAERLTSGRRDAYQVTVAGAENAGFAITWQEDPDGLQAGSGDGPGDGFSGATVAHQTDIWYTYLTWSDFDVVAEDPISEDGAVDDNPNDPLPLEIGGGGTGEERLRFTRFTMPVRITDNAACNFANLNSDGHKWCRLTTDGTVADLDGNDDGQIDVDAWPFDPNTVEPSTVPNGRIDISSLDLKYCDALVWSQDVSVGWVCQTDDGRVLDGDTGASRPNLFLQGDGKGGAYAIMGYEETKGLGTGPTDVDTLYVDDGKNVVYHSFNYNNPAVIARGDIVNLPERDENGNLLVLIEGDETHPPVYATENARRVRFILQGAKAAKGPTGEGAGTVMIAIYKQGPEGKGRPSDIFARRMTIRNEDGTFKTGNPYVFGNFVCAEADAWGQCLKGAQNLSSVAIEETEAPTSCGSEECYDKLVSWSWSTDNLEDESWTTPMTEARAHRGQIRGDFVVMGYTWTPNWAASRMGNDKFDFYVRRSFDGGQTWTTGPKPAEHCQWVDPTPGDSGDETLECTTIAAGQPEPPRNVSLLRSNHESVIEPRIVAVDGTLLCGEVPCTPEDKQNANVFIASYGLANNIDVDGDGELEQEEQFPTDMYYSRSTDKGATYLTVYYPSDDTAQPARRWDWLAKRADVEEGEAQLRLTPDGNLMYGTWLAESCDVTGSCGEGGYTGPDHFQGSDIWFRKIDFNVEEAAE